MKCHALGVYRFEIPPPATPTATYFTLHINIVFATGEKRHDCNSYKSDVTIRTEAATITMNKTSTAVTTIAATIAITTTTTVITATETGRLTKVYVNFAKNLIVSS